MGGGFLTYYKNDKVALYTEYQHNGATSTEFYNKNGEAVKKVRKEVPIHIELGF